MKIGKQTRARRSEEKPQKLKILVVYEWMGKRYDCGIYS